MAKNIPSNLRLPLKNALIHDYSLDRPPKNVLKNHHKAPKCAPSKIPHYFLDNPSKTILNHV